MVKKIFKFFRFLPITTNKPTSICSTGRYQIMKNPQQIYQRQAIMNASKEELIVKLYNFAIVACHQKDGNRLQEILQVLVKSLNFEYEISGSLFSMYEYCQAQAEKGEFEEVRDLLEPIRDTWEESVARGQQSSGNLNVSTG